MFPFINIFSKQISTYGLCMLIALFLVTYLVSLKAKKKDVPGAMIILIAAMVFLFAMLGAGFLYLIVTYPIDYIISEIISGSFNFNIGLVFYGGLIGGIGGAFVGAKIARVKLMELEDAIVPYIPLGHAIGRVGCFLAGCCYGMEYSGPCAVYYPNSIFGLSPDVGYFPVQLLESALDLCIMGYLLLYSTKKNKTKGELLFEYLWLYALMRIFTECFRGDAIRGVFSGFSTSQWVSIGMILASILFKIFVIIKEARSKKEQI